MLGLAITDSSFLDVYYQALGKKEPGVSTKTHASDLRSIQRIRKGDCIIDGSNGNRVREYLCLNGYSQPTAYVYRIWKDVVTKNSSLLPRYCCDFVFCDHTTSTRIQDISLWLWLVCKDQTFVSTPEQQYLIDRFLAYNPRVDTQQLTGAAVYAVNQLEILQKSSKWITMCSITQLVDIMFTLWVDILDDVRSDLSVGHLRSEAMYQRLLPSYLQSQCLIQGSVSDANIITRCIPVAERRCLPDCYELENRKWVDYR